MHILHGGSKSTWSTSSGGATWLKDQLLPDQSVRIMRYGYATSDTSEIIYTRKRFSDEASKLLESLLELRNEADEVNLIILNPSTKLLIRFH